MFGTHSIGADNQTECRTGQVEAGNIDRISESRTTGERTEEVPTGTKNRHKSRTKYSEDNQSRPGRERWTPDTGQDTPDIWDSVGSSPSWASDPFSPAGSTSPASLTSPASHSSAISPGYDIGPSDIGASPTCSTISPASTGSAISPESAGSDNRNRIFRFSSDIYDENSSLTENNNRVKRPNKLPLGDSSSGLIKRPGSRGSKYSRTSSASSRSSGGTSPGYKNVRFKPLVPVIDSAGRVIEGANKVIDRTGRIINERKESISETYDQLRMTSVKVTEPVTKKSVKVRGQSLRNQLRHQASY